MAAPSGPPAVTLSPLPIVLFLQHHLKIERCLEEKAWLSIAGPGETLYTLIVVQVSASEDLRVVNARVGLIRNSHFMAITQSLGGDIWDQ